MGESGTGKTYSLRTLLEAGIQPFVIFTEPGMEVLGDLAEKIKWAYVAPSAPDWQTLISSAQKVNQYTYENLLKIPDPNKSKLQHFYSVLQLCQNFKSHDGEEYGDVTTWGTNRALVLDSLSGFGEMAMQMVVGSKLAKAQHEWGLAQNLVESVVNKLVTDTRCWFILTAHIERETDEITGGSRLMVSTLGRKLAPKLPRFFSDVIQTVREGKEFSWDTAGFMVATKARNLPIASKQAPSFVSLVIEWQKRGGIIEADTP